MSDLGNHEGEFQQTLHEDRLGPRNDVCDFEISKYFILTEFFTIFVIENIHLFL